MSQTRALKLAVKALVAGVPGIGTVDDAALDPDGIPRAAARNDRPYWSLSLRRTSQRPAAIGGGRTARPVFRTYALRLEGWLGIVGAEEQFETWERLVERIRDRLSLEEQRIARYPGVSGFLRIDALDDTQDVVRVSEGSAAYRAHHVVLTANLETYEVVTP